MNQFHYVLHLNGTPVLSTRRFACANRAAFDDLPGFRALTTARDLLGHPYSIPNRSNEESETAIAQVYNHEGILCVVYEIRRGQLALPLDSTDPRIMGVSHAGAGF